MTGAEAVGSTLVAVGREVVLVLVGFSASVSDMGDRDGVQLATTMPSPSMALRCRSSRRFSLFMDCFPPE
jgi:hypothetical protein